MKLSEAKKIVGSVIEWQFYLQGIKEDEPEKLDKKLSLNDLIKANNIVKKDNEKRRKLQQQKKKGNKKGISISLTLNDRLIAAVYVAMNYKPDSEVFCVVNMVGVGCVKMKK